MISFKDIYIDVIFSLPFGTNPPFFNRVSHYVNHARLTCATVSYPISSSLTHGSSRWKSCGGLRKNRAFVHTNLAWWYIYGDMINVLYYRKKNNNSNRFEIAFCTELNLLFQRYRTLQTIVIFLCWGWKQCWTTSDSARFICPNTFTWIHHCAQCINWWYQHTAKQDRGPHHRDWVLWTGNVT